MKKTCVFLAGILLVILIIFACEMPNSVKFNSDKFQVNAPVKIGRFNISTVLSESLRSAFPEGFEIYDMVDYPNVLAFLIGYPMDLLESFNPNDYVKDIKDQMNTMNNLAPDNIDPIHPEPITIPQMTSNPLPTEIDFYMQDFFDNIRDIINATTKSRTVAFPYHLPYFMVYEDCDITKQCYFDSISVGTGNIVLNMWLEGAAPGLTVDIGSINFGSSDYNQSVQLSSLSHNAGKPCQVIINIDGAGIDKNSPPEFILNNVSPLSGYTLVIQPQICDITLSKAEKLRIGEMEEKLPDEICENIRLEPVPNMFNAKIEAGNFRLIPPVYTEPTDPTKCENMILGYRITIDQYPVELEGFSPFEGLDSSEFTDTNNSLAGKYISGNELTVNDVSRIIIRADPVHGTTFDLSGEIMLPIIVDMGMNIDKLERVCWKSTALPPIHIPPIDFKGSHETSFVKSIIFSEMKLDVDFIVPGDPGDPPSLPPPLLPGSSGLPDELINHIALRISCPDLGFDDDNSANTRILEGEYNTFTSEMAEKLDIDDSNHQIKINASLLPVIKGEVKKEDFPYMEFGPVDMRDENDNYLDNVKMNIYAQVSMDCDWSEAEVDLKAALTRSGREPPDGKYPDDAEDPVNLSAFGKYMQGITFGDSIQAKVFLSGPGKLVEIIQPQIDFIARWNYEDETEPMTEIMINKEDVKIGEKLPELPGKNSDGELVYYGLDLPEPDGGIVVNGSLGKVLGGFPQDLRFSYEIILPDADKPLIVYPDTFDDVEEDEDSKIKALLVILLPLEFVAEPGGYFAMPGLFGDSGDSEDGEDDKVAADIFGRKKVSDDSLFTGINIKSLGFRIDFGNSFYAGSRLHFDRDDILFGEDGISLGGGSSLNIIFTGEHLRTIDENLIYPDIKFVFPEGKTLQVGKYFLPFKIVIAASGNYTLDLDDLGLGN
jgi:hypothetical protein